MKKKTIVQEKLVNVHKLNYDDVKGDLKGHFNVFMKDPSKFGVEDPKLVKEIQGIKGLSKHFMWKQFKKAVKLKMEDLAQKEAASAFIIDFEQDKDHQLLTVKQLEKILDDPENPDFALEDDMIDYINSKSFDKKSFMKHVIDLDSDLEVDEDDHDGMGIKVLSFLKGLWKKLFPIVDKIVDTLVDLGTAALKNVLEKHVPEYLKEVVEETVNTLGEGVKEVDDLVNDLVISTVNTKEEVEEKKVDISGENSVEETI